MDLEGDNLAKREQNEKLNELFSQGKNVYSISKLNAIDGCLLEAYYSYVAKPRPKRMQNIYGIMGGEIHEVLEKIYNGESTSDELLPAMQRELEDADLVGVDFPKDMKGGTSIRDNWVKDMTHFCNNFEMIPGDNFSTEELIIMKINDDRYMQGYIDLISVIDEDKKVIDIYDFKTSGKFKSSDLTHHGRQLVLYGLAKESEGYKIGRVGWAMLKYIKVRFDGYKRANSKKKTQIEKVIQRSKIAKELKSVVEDMLYEAGYDEITAEIILNDFIDTNDINVLPYDIAKNFEFEQYIEYYDYNDDTKAEVLDYINRKADEFEGLLDQGKSAWTPVEITEKNSFYCFNLCAHRDKCEQLQRYRAEFEKEEEKSEYDDLF